MSSQILPFILFGCIAIFIIAVIMFNKRAVVKRKLKKSKITPISQVKNESLVKISGAAVPIDAPFPAPLSGRDCLRYEIYVDVESRSNKNSHWKNIIEDTEETRFAIKDGDFHAVIVSKNIKCYLIEDAKYTSHFGKDASEKLENYLKNHGHKSENGLGMNKNIRYREGIIEPNEKITAFGLGVWQRGADLGMEELGEQVLVLTNEAHDFVYLSDDPKTMKY